MSNVPTHLPHPPITEAVIDLDCDLPPNFSLAALEEPSRNQFRDRYPEFRKQFVQQYMFEASVGSPPRPSSGSVAVQALQFLKDDEKQLVQLRAQGYSFNRLAPYTTLDDYIAEIERTWRIYIDLVSPIQLRIVRLRYINRILLPTDDGRVDLDEFLKVGPRVPDEQSLTLEGFFSQVAANQNDTGHEVNLVLASQPATDHRVPVILDITAAHALDLEPSNWVDILQLIESLRKLKNQLFFDSLTEKCIELFKT